MAPKFRGGSDDWLDDESARNAARGAARKAPKKGKLIPAEDANATVAEVFPKRARVRLDADGAGILCHYRRSTVIGRDIGSEARERAPVAVGDRVKMERLPGQEGLIIGVTARRNQLSRSAPDQDESLHHILVANLDRLVIVASAHSPDFSAGLVDRFLVAASDEKIPCILAVTKKDLVPFGQSSLPWRMYAEFGVEVVEISRTDDAGVEDLRARITGQAAAFCGHSGVGKTTLLERLLGKSAGAIGIVNEQTGKGRHTTSSAVLLEGEKGSAWIDTPGVREFGLVEILPEKLKDHFPELVALGSACAAPSCLHHDEEGCQARTLVRYGSYRRILEDLLERQSESASGRNSEKNEKK